ncbi:selenium metabolism-associated LysR family transcriptional regulator [Clostridium sp. Marseille-P2415]|uniref:selenium metabolism-associated LysR family transcriptional regulator n=1 Tax=Clostridium sp. Marseille-P2415 TaxID=1805471 RepID=UPI0009889346|nr:selenium metabolism-associated LysR family transcriptional regulator [Clostridium sp. Marseille-P2415]
MNLKQLEAFVCVAEVKSFSAAAKKLYLTQPTVSAHIGSLEKELGVRLFIRTTKDVELSGEGERLYDNARKMLQLEKNILRDFTQKDRKAAKKIIVGASTVPGQYILPQILSLFTRTYPGNQLELKEADSMEVVRMVQEGQVEIGFTGTMGSDPACVFEPFYLDRLVIITPNIERYRQYEKTGFPLERFYEERWIVREEGSGTRKEAERHLKDMGLDLSRLEIVATINNQETIKKSVGAAMGISIISSAAVEDYVKQGSLLRFSLSADDVYRKLYMVWSKNHKPGKAARLFLQFVRELYAYL